MYSNQCVLFYICWLMVSQCYLYGQDIKLESELTPIRRVIKDTGLIQDDQPFVGFSVWKKFPQSYVNQDVIVFDGIILNEGNYYDPEESKFTCPVDGVYYVSVTFKRMEEFLFLEVVKNGDFVLTVSDPNGDDYYKTASNSGLVKCSWGEQLWVAGSGVGDVYGGPNTPYTTFNVMLMETKEDNPYRGSTAWIGTLQRYENGDLINFPHILYNDGGYYSLGTNSFSCPVDGIYYISVNLKKSSSTQMLQLAVEKNTVTVLHANDVSTVNHFTPYSNSRLIKCYQGDEVLVRANGGGSVTGSDPHAIYSTFTVMLIHETGINNRRQPPFVGFTAFIKLNQDYETGDVIDFEGILLNEGDHFDLTTNHFTCPLNGIYYIAVTLKRLLMEPLMVDVELLTTSVLRLSSTVDNNAGSAVSNTCMVRCFIGEDIHLRAAGNGSVLGDPDRFLSTFTVMLLHEY